MRWLVVATIVGCGAGAGSGAAAGPDLPRAQAGPGFWDQWGDGRAELSGYRLTTPRYDELRSGSAVLVFVTEDFTEGQRVKSDGGHGDEYPVLKLNEIRHFQTGIYDYEVMTSTFVRVDGTAPIGQPVKVSLGMQEWCGHVYEQLLPRGSRVARVGHSYFDGEGDHADELPLPRDGVFADALPMLVRGVVGDWPAAGVTIEVPVLPTLMSSRFAHQPPSWTTATITRGDAVSERTVPAGTFRVTEVRVALATGLVTTWAVEVDAPHRIVGWTTSDGEVAELTGSTRLPYWQLHREGDEVNLAALGLAPATGLATP
ncbi:MAG: hypothetical protein ABMB14_18230 [Myxococcota bacterium]